MTAEIFLILLTIFSTVTSLVTEAVKKMLGEKQYSSNIVVLVVAAIVGGVGTAIYYVVSGSTLNAVNIIYIGLMMLANWIGSMVGYDKVKQAITQFKKN